MNHVSPRLGLLALQDLSLGNGSPWKWKKQAKIDMEHSKSVIFIVNIDWKKSITFYLPLLFIILWNPAEILQNRYYLYFTAGNIVAERLNDVCNAAQHGYADFGPESFMTKVLCIYWTHSDFINIIHIDLG